MWLVHYFITVHYEEQTRVCKTIYNFFIFTFFKWFSFFHFSVNTRSFLVYENGYVPWSNERKRMETVTFFSK